MVKNDYAPFLRGHMIWPGQAVQLKKKPKSFHFKGGVTHHDIYVNVSSSLKPPTAAELKCRTDAQWISRADVKTKVPSSLIRKALAVLDLDDAP